jgi:hypothetical protein
MHRRTASGGRDDEETDMQYLLLIYAKESEILSASQEETGRRMAAYRAYTEAMKKEGVYLGSNRLQPISTATAVRVTDGKTQVADGPFAETKEQLGGYFLIDVPNLESALNWAARCPGAAHGVMEVRPIWTL